MVSAHQTQTSRNFIMLVMCDVAEMCELLHVRHHVRHGLDEQTSMWREMLCKHGDMAAGTSLREGGKEEGGRKMTLTSPYLSARSNSGPS